MTVHTRAEVDGQLTPFAVERVDELDDVGGTVVGTRKYRHIYHVGARRL